MIVVDDPDDSLTDPTFVPCRDDRCQIEGIHREHHIKLGRGRPSKDCPLCGSCIVRKPGERARCSTCDWHGYFVKNHKENKRA